MCVVESRRFGNMLSSKSFGMWNDFRVGWMSFGRLVLARVIWRKVALSVFLSICFTGRDELFWLFVLRAHHFWHGLEVAPVRGVTVSQNWGSVLQS